MLKKGDMILAAVLLVIILASFGGLELYKRHGAAGGRIAVIKQNDKIIRRINLDAVNEPETIKISGDYNNIVLVEKGHIRFHQANCPDLVCVKTGWLDKKGDLAVCLPNRTIIIIEGDNNEVDGVAY